MLHEESALFRRFHVNTFQLRTLAQKRHEEEEEEEEEAMHNS
jgi:hypothetical protein